MNILVNKAQIIDDSINKSESKTSNKAGFAFLKNKKNTQLEDNKNIKQEETYKKTGE